MNKAFLSNSPWSLALFSFFVILGQTFVVQKNETWTLAVGLFFYGLSALLFLNITKDSTRSAKAETSTRWEYGFLFFIFLLTTFLRTYHLDQFPTGFTTDQAQLGFYTQQIAHEHLRPLLETFGWLVAMPDIYYSLAAWFHFVPVSQISFFLYGVFISLLALPFLYFFFRSLTDAPTALMALFFLYISRWFLTYSRDTHPAVGVPLIIGLTLTFWIYAIRSSRTWAFVLCGMGLALGLYDYPNLKFLPLLILIYGIYEWRLSENKPRFLVNTFFLFVAFCLFSAPILHYLIQEQGMTSRERYLLAFPRLYVEQGFTGVWDHLLNTLLVFNRQGDPWAFDNIPNHRLLDDVTGALWIPGLVYALFHLKERKAFYPLLGFLVFFLPAFLSIDSRHGSRLIGTLPFLFLLAAQCLRMLHQKTLTLWPRMASTLFILVLLFLSFGQNTWDYFKVQAKTPDCWEVGAAESWVANSVRRYSKDDNCLLCQRFHGNFQVLFLDYDLLAQIGYWKFPASLNLIPKDPHKGVCLFFEEGQWGALKVFQSLYPGGTTELFKDLNGVPIAALYSIPLPALISGLSRLEHHPFAQGLRGFYYRSVVEKGQPILTQTDPVLNFTFRNDFPFSDFPPLAVRWSGQLTLPQDGTYEWTVLTSDDFEMNIDGKEVLSNSRKDRGLFFKKGNHRLTAHFKKTSGVDTILNLLWKTPGADHFEVVPYQVLKPSLR